MHEQLRVLDLAEPPEQWSDIERRVPRLETDPPLRRSSRITSALLAIAIAVAGVTFAVRALMPSDQGPRLSRPSAPMSSIQAYTDPTGLWTVNYPSSWTATPISRTSDGLATGVTISSVPNPHPLQPGAVVLTVTHSIDAASHPPVDDSSFPLSVADAKVEPGTSNTSDLTFRGNGLAYLARVVIGSAATEQDVADLGAVMASIRFPSLADAGQVANGWTSLGSAKKYPKGVGRAVPFGTTGFGYVLRGPASTYLLDLPLPTSYTRGCAEGLNDIWDRVHLQIWIQCPAGDVRFERDGTPVSGNPLGLTRHLVAYPVITAWDGTFLLSPTPMTRSQEQHAWS